jgi:hypothetical protein
MRLENKEAFSKIRFFINCGYDKTSLWYKVNWVIVTTSHKISERRGSHGHKIRQKFRHTNWRLAQQFYPELRIYKIPYDIRGDSPVVLKGWLYRTYERLIRRWD